MDDDDSSASGHDTAEERPRRMLTEADRRYLRGEEQFDNENTENSKRHRIRQRIRNAIFDFSVAHGGLERSDVGMIYDVEEEDALRDAMIDAIAFLYLGSDEFDAMVEEGIERAVREYTNFEMPDVSVTLHIDQDPVHIDDVIEMIESGEQLPPKAQATAVLFDPPLDDENRRVLEDSDHPAADLVLGIDDDYLETYGDDE